MNSTIRELQNLADISINKILDIALKSKYISLNYNDIKHYIESKYNKIFVICDEDVFLGFIIFSYIEDEIDIVDIAVSDKYFHCGVGSNIIKYLIEYARKNNAKKITLELDERNTVAYKFYKRHGFVNIARRERYYNNEHAAIVMEFRIQ